MLKTVIQAIPTYFMSILLLPKTLCAQLNKIMQRFIRAIKSMFLKFIGWVGRIWDFLKLRVDWSLETWGFYWQNNYGDLWIMLLWFYKLSTFHKELLFLLVYLTDVLIYRGVCYQPMIFFLDALFCWVRNGKSIGIGRDKWLPKNILL